MRIALIADTHLSARAPACVANWHAARRAVERLGVDLTLHLGDVTLDGQVHPEELAFAAERVRQWPTPMRCVPGNHDQGDGSGEEALVPERLAAFGSAFGPVPWKVDAEGWTLLGIDAQLLGSDSPQEAALWQWIDDVAPRGGASAATALFLHRPLVRPRASALDHERYYVAGQARERLLGGALQPSLRLVVSGHAHQVLDRSAQGVRHLWMPSAAYILPDSMQERVGEKVVGIGLLELADGEARFDLWCPEGMVRYDLSALSFSA